MEGIVILLVAGNDDNTTKRLMKSIGKEFEMTNLGGESHYLGIDIERDRKERFCISQPKYIDRIIAEVEQTNVKTSRFSMDTSYSKQLGTPLNSNDEYHKTHWKVEIRDGGRQHSGLDDGATGRKHNQTSKEESGTHRDGRQKLHVEEEC
jgi:hypothetical protein